MRVVLIFPGISESGFNNSGERVKFAWINHGLASISASAKREGFEVELVDLRQLGGWEEFSAEVRRLQPRIAGISMMSVDFDYGIKAASIIKEVSKDITVVVGGAHPTLMPEEVLAYSCVDHVILGEAELSFVDLLKRIEKGLANPRVIRGRIPDLDSLPFIDRELFKCEEVPIDGFLPRPFVTLIAGRGCTYNCSFCQPAERIMFGSKVRRRNPENVIGELVFLKSKFGFNSFMLHDDCLTEDERWVRKFCESYSKEGFRRPFVCQTRADIICKKEAMVKLMKKAGLSMFLIGFESGSQRILNFLRKGTTVEQNYKAASVCKKYAIRIWANYMLGVPTETKEEAEDTLEMIKRIKPYRASPSFYTPHPGSDLYEYCRSRDLSLIESSRNYSRSPREPKIRGIDYEFLRKILRKSVSPPLLVKVRRRLDSIFVKKRIRLLQRIGA